MSGICETRSILPVGSLPCLWILLRQIFIKIGSRQLLIVHKWRIRTLIAKVYPLLCEDKGCSYKNQQNLSLILPCITVGPLKEESDLSFFVVCLEENWVVERNESCHSPSSTSHQVSAWLQWLLMASIQSDCWCPNFETISSLPFGDLRILTSSNSRSKL